MRAITSKIAWTIIIAAVETVMWVAEVIEDRHLAKTRKDGC
jgi:hypothetical protein